MKPQPIRTLYLGSDDVLPNDGWDSDRRPAAVHLQLHWDELDQPHGLNFTIYEQDKLTR